MTHLDYYERHLLALAVEECDRAGGTMIFYNRPPSCRVSCWNEDGNNGPDGRGDTLADALTALLTDLGVQVPERPSEERVEKAMYGPVPIQDIVRRDPLLAAAVLEAGR